MAQLVASRAAADVAEYRMVGTRGDIRLDPRLRIVSTALKAFVTVDQATSEKTYAKRDQFAPELVHFSNAILEGTEPEPSGREKDLCDVRILGDRNVRPATGASGFACLPSCVPIGLRSNSNPRSRQWDASARCTRRRRIGTLEPTGCGAKTQPMPKRGLLLDIDGTLLDNRNGAHAAAYVDALAGEEIDVPVERVQILIGMGGEELLALE